MNFDASESRSAYGPNLLGRHQYYNNQNVTITENNDGSLKAVSDQSTSTPGLWPLGGGNNSTGDIEVSLNTDYTFRTYSKFDGGGGSAAQYVWSNSNGNLVWIGDYLTDSNYKWYTNSFNTGANNTRLRVGILWSSAAVGSTFTVKEWRLYDRSRWWDSIGNSAGAIKYNGVTHTPVSQSANGTVTAGYWSLDGVDDHFQTPQEGNINNINYPSVEVWFRPTGSPGGNYHSICQKDGGYSGGATYGLRATSGSNPVPYTTVWYSSASGDLIQTTGNQNLDMNQWSHLMSTYDGTNLKLYVNGVLTGVNTGGAGRAVYNVNSYFKIGTGDSRYAAGDIGAVRVYDRPLTEKEVIRNFNATRHMYGI
jgi:hypothetical protein